MSSDAKIWHDKDGWHGICDDSNHQVNDDDYSLNSVIGYIESVMGQRLHWEIFEFGNGLGLRGYRAKPYGDKDAKPPGT